MLKLIVQIYYNSSQVSNVNGVKSKVMSVLNTFSTSNINKFGGRFKYSKLGQIIDGSDKFYNIKYYKSHNKT